MQENTLSTEAIDIKFFSSDKKSSILLTPFFIVIEIKKEEISALTETLQSNFENYKPASESKIIHLNHIDDLKFVHDDSALDINYHLGEKSTYSSLSFENEQTRTDFVEAFNTYTKNLFESETVQCTRKEAASAPLCLMLFFAIVGPLLTYVVNAVHHYEPTRTRILKSYVAIFYGICKLIGPYPIAILSILLFLFCTVWLIMNITKPPMKTLMKRKAVL